MAAIPAVITVMTRAAEKAARNLLRDFGEVQNLQISRKGPGDFVSAADKKAEKIIQEDLEYSRPGFSFLMEEGGQVKGATDSDARWIIDPLDGTLNFLHGVPHWCISIALEEKGVITAGVVMDPIKDETFWATRGGGAFMRKGRLRVSGREDITESLLGFGDASVKSRTALRPQLHAIHDKVMTGTRRSGSAALDLAYVAAGRLDGYWENDIHAWDVAAGWLLVKEAGGVVSDLKGTRDAHHAGNIIATNAHLHKPLTDLLNGK